MSWTTPVTDRTPADLVARNSKAFMNTGDWTRIYENSRIVFTLVEIDAGESFTFNTISTPTITSIPTITDVNKLVTNIEGARLEAAVLATIPGALTPIKFDWEDGPSVAMFGYRDVNLWESTLLAIFNHYDPDICPTLTGDLTVTTGTNHIVIDCLDMDTFNVDLQGTANLYII